MLCQNMLKRTLIAGLLLVLPLVPGKASAEDLQVVPFGQSGYWQVLAVFDASSRFDHCMATVLYSTGMRLSFNAHASGSWQLQVYDPSWPSRQLAQVAASLTLGQSRFDGVAASMSGQSIFVELTSLELAALEGSDVMLVDTPYELVSADLLAPRDAADMAADCQTQHTTPG